MLRITPSSSAEGAKQYFDRGLAQGDYYFGAEEIVGNWGGRAATLLGLDGQVTREGFHRLCDNQHPGTGETLTARTRENRRVGYDFTFSVPKSVSVMYGVFKDERIQAAFRASVAETMGQLEDEMQARVRVAGQSHDRKTANMVWAEFVHTTARPIDGVPDPHLHAHLFVHNVTWDPVEERFKAGQFGQIKRDAPYYQAVFHNHLARRLEAFGYAVELRGDGWQLAGIPQEVVREFSRRTRSIEAEAARLGITDDERKSQLGARTRQSKGEPASWGELQAAWQERITLDQALALREAVRGSAEPATPPLAPDAAVDWALRHCFERRSVIPERRFLAEALEKSVGRSNSRDLQRSAANAGMLVSGGAHGPECTTRQILAEERSLLRLAQSERGAWGPLCPEPVKANPRLGDDQRHALEHLMTCSDGVLAVRGPAGTGKTTLMREAARQIRANGRRIYAFAPSAQASRGVLRSEGFANAETVAKLLSDEELQASLKGQVVWVDEAGQLGAADLGRIIQIAKEQQARVVLTGDVRQHAAVDRGDALRLLETHGGVNSVEITTIRRQRGAYRDAVQALSSGDAQRGLEVLEQMGAVIELPDEERYEAMATTYLEVTSPTATGQTQSALVVAPTHAEGAKVTAAVRAALRAEGRIGQRDRLVRRLDDLRWTEAQRSEASQYREGLIVRFYRSTPASAFESGVDAEGEGSWDPITKPKAIGPGEELRVEGLSADGLVRCSDALGRMRYLPVRHASRFGVFREGHEALASGDVVRVLRNGRSRDGKHRLQNGAHYRIEGISPEGHVRLENGWELDAAFGGLAPGYCTTSHASQGKTVDHVLIAQGGESLAAASREQLYVSVSRARKSVRLFTDDRSTLLQGAQRSSQRLLSTDWVGEGAQGRSGAYTSLLTRLRGYVEQVRQQVAAPVASLQARYGHLINHWREMSHGRRPARGLEK